MGTLFVTASAWFARGFATLGLARLASLAFLGPIGPIFAGIANAIGAVITAIFEIIVSLSKSAEGRVVLGLGFAVAGFLYLRFHYIEEGKTEATAKLAETHKLCQAQPSQRRKR